VSHLSIRRPGTLVYCDKSLNRSSYRHTQYHTHSHLTAPFLGLPGWAGTRKVTPIWILLKQQTASGSGISWAICKSARCSRQITMSATHHSLFYRPDAIPAAQQTASKHYILLFKNITVYHGPRQSCMLKQCKTETLWLWTVNRKWGMGNQIVTLSLTKDDNHTGLNSNLDQFWGIMSHLRPDLVILQVQAKTECLS